ncbi:MAG: 8-amino-7-oxononanoate synthase [Gammaproteobacteria bacterium]|nr:8-amino-7-oxononanoate synthase [Gammaproteobacteria bacterium]
MHAVPPLLEETFRFRAACSELRDRSLLRQRLAIGSPQGASVRIGGDPVLNFCSNDYLGLANDPRLVSALKAGADRYGVGAGASSLVCGRSRAHEELESRVAAFTCRDRALLFCSGYMANLALGLSGLVGAGDHIIEDRLNHASLIDAARVSGARLVRYRHRDVDAATALIGSEKGKQLVLTDGVFSMDGDVAPIESLAQACRAAGTLLAVDDAHGIGVLGGRGGGTLELAGIGQDAVPILVGTFGKSFGTAGAFIAGPGDIIEYLCQRARTYIYTTASSPALTYATSCALEVAAAEPERRQRLFERIDYFRAGATAARLPLLDSMTPIQPLMLGSARRAAAVSDALRSAGILVTPVRPPTVAQGKSRLRITITAAHSFGQIDALLEHLVRLLGPGATP